MPSAIVDKTQGTYVIPAQHTDRLRNILSGTEVCPVPRERIVQQIFSADYGEIFSLPLEKIDRLPTTEQKAARLVQCANYRPGDPLSCTMGDRCKFVHANTEGAPRHSVHINYAWPSLDTVTYERFAPGKTLKVAAPSSKTITDVMESHMVLETQALSGTRRPLSHCAHYYFNRTCNLGSECQFIHAVFIDPMAKPYQRAPAPTQLGRPRRGRESMPPRPLALDDADLLPMNEISPVTGSTVGNRDASQLRSPGGDSTASDGYCAAAEGEAIVDPLAAVMLNRTPQTTPATTPTRRSATPQVEALLCSPGAGGASDPQQSGNSGHVTPVYRHTPYGSRQNSFVL